MDFVTVHSDFVAMEAQLVRARLEAAGFHPFIANENPAGNLGGYSKSNLVHVEVPAAEAAEAAAFLAANDPPP